METGRVNESQQKEYDEHQARKTASRKAKQIYKSRTETDKTFYAATFDLQAVLKTPCSIVGELHYKRNISCYNISIYFLGDQKGVCYLWDETRAQRGACEIKTAIYIHTMS